MSKERIRSAGKDRTIIYSSIAMWGAMIEVRKDDHYVGRAQRVRAFDSYILQHDSFCLDLWTCKSRDHPVQVSQHRARTKA
jgi:hypothetical protein